MYKVVEEWYDGEMVLEQFKTLEEAIKFADYMMNECLEDEERCYIIYNNKIVWA